jgi:uncharacterized protein (DUF2126 family)
MTKDEELAMDLALRSLKELVPDESDYAPAIQGQRKRQEKAIIAIKHARSAPVQEKWGASAVMNPDYMAAQKEKSQQALDVMAENARELGLDYESVPENFIDALKFDVAMRDAAPVQEPVAVTYKEVADTMNALWGGTLEQVQIAMELANKKLYTTSPAAQRQWVGLTDDERVDLWKATETDNRMVLIDAIEAKLKEKNT